MDALPVMPQTRVYFNKTFILYQGQENSAVARKTKQQHPSEKVGGNEEDNTDDMMACIVECTVEINE